MHLRLLGLLPLSTSISVLLLTWVSLASGTSQKVCVCSACMALRSLLFSNAEYVFVTVIVYKSLGYIEVVAAAAEDSMKMAVNEVKEMAGYAEKGEVHLNLHVFLCVMKFPFIFFCSGLLQTRDMTPLLMRIILRYHVYLEGLLLTHISVQRFYCNTWYSTHKIVGICTISRKEHGTAQTREMQCTKVLLPQVVSRGKNTRLYCIV